MRVDFYYAVYKKRGKPLFVVCVYVPMRGKADELFFFGRFPVEYGGNAFGFEGQAEELVSIEILASV